MHNLLAIIAGLIAVLATLPYIFDTVKNKTHPNIITWFTWTLLNGITALAAFSGGATQTAIFATGGALCTGAVTVAGLKHGIKKYNSFDITCQILAIIGVILWRISNNPSVAISFNIAADMIGVLPTYRHAWQLPHQETWQTFFYGVISSLIGILSVEKFNYLSVAYPAYLLLSDMSLVIVIKYRLKLKSN